MSWRLHPQAALEHEEQFAWYETRRSGLGSRYHAAFKTALAGIVEAPYRYPVVRSPCIRSAALHGFPFRIVFREGDGEIQVLAVAHHRKRPGYWVRRL